MIRLTDRSKEIPLPLQENAAFWARAHEKLARYEDSGLDPEEIYELLHSTTGPLHKKLGEWIDADRDGRIIILPCEIGHPIFILRGDVEDGYETRKKTNIQVVGFTLGCLNKKFELYPFYFLTREEAEAALKGDGEQ